MTFLQNDIMFFLPMSQHFPSEMSSECWLKRVQFHIRNRWTWIWQCFITVCWLLYCRYHSSSEIKCLVSGS